MPKTMCFTKVFGVFVCFGTFAIKNTPLRALGLRSGMSGEPLGGVLGASRGLFRGPKGPLGGVLGATWGLLGASWGPPGANLGPKKALGGLLKVSKSMCFTMVFAIVMFWAVLPQKIQL